MKLPKRGFLYDTEGRILWAWDHNDPTTDFIALPPLMTDPTTGEQIPIARPTDAIMNMEGLAEKGDIPTLYNDMGSVRLERATCGAYCFKQEITDSAGYRLRIDHPIMSRINARRRLNKQPALPSTPDRIIKPRGST